MENLTDSINGQCCVCFNTIEENEKCFLKCSHFLCQTCIDSWFDQNKTTCRMCRDEIKYYKKDSENFRIIHSRRNRQLQEQIMIDNDHHRQIVVFCRISFILNYFGRVFSKCKSSWISNEIYEFYGQFPENHESHLF